MEDIVHAGYSAIYSLSITDITFKHLHRASFLGLAEILPTAANEVVQDAHLGGSCRLKLVHNCTTHESGSAGDKDACSGNLIHRNLRSAVISSGSSRFKLVTSVFHA